MKPVLVLVGRPNVGKSTLFNRLTKSRDALVADQPGLTRDRQYGEGLVGSLPYIIVDTGGLSGEGEGIDELMAQQSWEATLEADEVLFLVDATAGMTPQDEEIAKRLRNTEKKISVVVNKIDGRDPDIVSAEFYALGFEHLYTISSSHGRGVEKMMHAVLDSYQFNDIEEQDEEEKGIKVAIIGRPNVGKSTLVNRILGEERVVSFDLPGTTRDSIYLPFERDGQRYTLIDTAGVRRRSRVKEAIEKFSVIKTLKAIEDAHVVVMLLDAHEGITEQDASILGFVLDAGRGLVLAINKWDGLDQDDKTTIQRELDLKLPFITFAKLHRISALYGTGVGELYASINQSYQSATQHFATPLLTRLLSNIVEAHPPPLVRGRRIKLRYAHQGGQNPPLIIIHGNQTNDVPLQYKRYLINAFSKKLKLVGTPLQVIFRTGDNPYKNVKNKLTKHQIDKKRRLMKHVKR
ncbi:GTP-binding protein EngA [hydrothermal vent metagenome]|uniref:GTPase Der n=1 Tax=hydrothermal vent metagenome TaxID=652676 RepID=A0A3B1A1B1_9ZZZZ